MSEQLEVGYFYTEAATPEAPNVMLRIIINGNAETPFIGSSPAEAKALEIAAGFGDQVDDNVLYRVWLEKVEQTV